MKKIGLVIVAVAILAFSLYFVSAENSSCPISVNAKSTSALISEIPSINAGLQSCPIEIPSQLKRLIKNGIFLVSINNNSDIAATIVNGNITSVQLTESGAYTYKITLSSCQLDVILSKQNPVGAFASYYLSGKADLGASGFFNRVKLFFAKLFLKPAFKNVEIPVDDCSNS